MSKEYRIMRIDEISSESRHRIKSLQNLYISYVLDETLFEKMTETISTMLRSDDADQIKEAILIKNKIILEIFRIVGSNE